MNSTQGTALDELLQNPRRLLIVHCALGLIAAFIFWARPGTFAPVLTRFQFRDVSPIFNTVISWAPYVIAYLNAKSILANRRPAAIYSYTALAAAITVISGCMYLNTFQSSVPLPALAISSGVAIALVTAASLCGFLWKAHTVE